jgi:glycosyltransferase involved in cell wall biosynthesis
MKFIYETLEKLPYRIKKLFAGYYGKKFYEFNLLPRIKKYPKAVQATSEVKNILSVNMYVGKGGAAKIAYDSLCKPLTARGFNAKILTSKNLYEKSDNIIEFINYHSKERKLLSKIGKKLNLPDFYQPESLDIVNRPEFLESDILHLHNLHENYFNPFVLPELSALKPTIWTLHDFGAFTGYCTVEYSCEKFINGCIDCPYLKKMGLKDTANFIWNTKKEIYKNSNITIVCPSLWLKEKVEKSILNHFDIQLIPHGINEKIFVNKGKIQAREELNLPPDKKILLFSADFGTQNPNKGGEYVKQAYESLKDREDLLFIAIGGEEIAYIAPNYLNVAYVYDEELMAKYYSASDLFIYPSLADTFGLVAAEAMACNTPVITFETGGIPEVVKHLKTGYIAKYKDSTDFINGINMFLNDDNLRINTGQNARKVIEDKFTLDIMINNYIQLYKETAENFNRYQ